MKEGYKQKIKYIRRLDMEDIKRVTEERHALAKKARGILDNAETEGRGLKPEESTHFDNLMAEVDKLDEKRARYEKLSAIEEVEKNVELEERSTASHLQADKPTDEYRDAFMAYLKRGRNGLNSDEVRALQVGTVSEGGATVYEEFENSIVQKLSEMNIMRQLATVVQTGGDHNIPVEDGEDSASWSSEEGAFAEDLNAGDSKTTFRKVVLGAHKMSYLIKVSEELLMDNGVNLEDFLSSKIASKFASLEEAAFVNGDNSGKPNGILQAATEGVNAASGTVITPDELIDLFHSLKRQYRTNASWIMADSTVKAIRKFKEATNEQYLWQPGLQAGQPDRILGRPVYTSSGAPDMATSVPAIAFGDMSYYWIADRGNRFIQRLNELYAANGQVGYRAYQRVDGDLTNTDAVKTLVMNAT